jgi:hypothetical protein
MNCVDLFSEDKGKLFKNHAMKAYWRSGVITPCIIRLCVRWGESASHTGHFTQSGKAPGSTE